MYLLVENGTMRKRDEFCLNISAALPLLNLKLKECNMIIIIFDSQPICFSLFIMLEQHLSNQEQYKPQKHLFPEQMNLRESIDR